MRAICEACSQRQPPDWQPGDLCIHCGQPAREQTRCYWCAHWVPVGNFCRACGAEAVAPPMYPAARMLKFYGSDMFSIPKLLREMDPGRLETFQAIYQRQHAVALRHVEDLRELEAELFQKHWSSALEEELISQLPWAEGVLASFDGPDKTGRNSPVMLTRNLAELVALRRGDFALLRHCGSGLSSTDAAYRLETALQMANWRVAGCTYLEGLRYPVLSALQASPDSMMKTLSQAYLGGEGVTVPEEALTSAHPEIAFFAALLLGQEQMLTEALREPDPKPLVAAVKLIRLGHIEPIVSVFDGMDETQQAELLSAVALEKRPVPALHPALLAVVARTEDRKLRRMAVSALCLGCSHDEALLVAQTGDWEALHALSLAKHFGTETFRAIGEVMVQRHMVDSSAFAWGCLAEPGRMPQDFVEEQMPFATVEEQNELMLFAEKQLELLPDIPRGTSMERVLIRAAFTDLPVKLIHTAWAALHRINYRRQYGSFSPFAYTRENVEQFWPMHEFEERLRALQANEAALAGTFVGEELARFVRSAEL